MIVLSLSGAIYLFVDEYEAMALAPYIQPLNPGAGEGRGRGLEDQWRGILETHPGYRATMLVLRPGRANEFVLARRRAARSGEGAGVSPPSNWALRSESGPEGVSVFVDAGSGIVTGEVNNDRRFMHLVKRLHGNLLLGGFGTKFVELAAQWGIVIAIMGAVLWWKRGSARLVPDLSKRGAALWHELHAVAGIHVLLPLLFLLVTGLPWTDVWGGWFKSIQRATGQSAAASFFDRSLRSAPHDGTQRPISLDEVVRVVRSHGLEGHLKIRLPRDADGAFNILREDHDPARRVVLQLDQYSGAVIRIGRWRDSPLLERIVALGIKIHRGEYFGRLNQFAGLVTALLLTAVSVLGAKAWIDRRPAGALGLPPRPDSRRVPGGWLVAAIVLSCLLPLFGATLLFGIVSSMFWRRWRSS